jgi:thymidine phosphorylase
MNTLIEAQGPQQRHFGPGSLVQDIGAPADGLVVGIDNLQMAHIARFAGAP